jgi:hypothetical protein
VQVFQLVHLRHHADLIVDDRGDVLVEHFLLLVGDFEEPRVGLFDLLLGELITKLSTAVGKSVPAGVTSEHHARPAQPDRLRRHDLIGAALLEDPVHVDARLVRERVGADDGLVGLDHESGQLGHQLAGAIDFLRVDVCVQPVGTAVGEEVGAGVDRHDDFFERGVSGPLAEPVDGDLDLPGPAAHARQRIGDRQTEVVVTVRADDALVDARDLALELGDELAVFVRQHVADGVRDVQRGGAGFDHGGQDLDEEGDFAASGVLRREFHVIDELPGALDRSHRHLHHLVGLLVELVLHVDRRGRDERVDAPPLGRCDGLARGFDVHVLCSRKSCNDRPLHLFRHEPRRLELCRRGDREARLDDVDPEGGQLLGDLELLRDRERGTGRLFAVT